MREITAVEALEFARRLIREDIERAQNPTYRFGLEMAEATVRGVIDALRPTRVLDETACRGT